MEIKKVVSVKMEAMNLAVSVDGDVDGEPSFLLQIKLPEVFSELISMFSKPKAA